MKINSIEGLRGYLAWWVVLGHTFHLSGLMEGTGNWFKFITAGGYIARRFFRVYPLFLVSVVLGLLLLQIRLDNLTTGGRLLEQSATYFLPRWQAHQENWLLYLPPVLGLFHGLMPSSLLPYAGSAFNGPIWSISLEMQFYALAPLLVFGFSKKSTRVVTALACVSMFVLRDSLIHTDYGSFFVEHLHFFALGWVSYYVFKVIQGRIDSTKRVSYGFVALCVFTLFYDMPFKNLLTDRSDMGLGEWLPMFVWIVFFCFVLDVVSGDNSLITRFFRWVFENKVIQMIGRWSYSAYLLHVPLLILVQHFLLRTIVFDTSSELLLAIVCVSFPLIVLFSWLSYRYIEVPGIKLGARLTRASSIKTHSAA